MINKRMGSEGADGMRSFRSFKTVSMKYRVLRVNMNAVD